MTSTPNAPSPGAWLWPDALDAVVAAPRHHIVLLENDRVRVLDTLIRPGERTNLRTHRWPMTLYVLSQSDFVRYDEHDRVTLDSRRLPGGVGAAPATALWSEPLPPHALENVGERDLHVISVELKR